MRLLVVHHHFRPGGVRRVIEQALPGIVVARPALTEVLLAGDAPPGADWLEPLRLRLAPVGLRFVAHPDLGYRAERATTDRVLGGRIRKWLASVLDGDPRGWVVWLHNPGLGRNAAATGALGAYCRARGIRVLWHHHDWWFDHRWSRWSELRRSVRSRAAAARALLGAGPGSLVATINREDFARARARLGARAAWWPNPVVPERPRRGRAGVRAARRWLDARTGAHGAPVWLLPSRFLRRKNVAEALLLVRWLRPEAWFVTTAGPSSPDEQPAFERLARFAAERGERLTLAALAGAGSDAPTVPELLAASEAVLFTSVLEGFGLPYLEAAAAGRPLVARRLANVVPDLTRLGFSFPTLYDEVRIDPFLFEAAEERARQRRLHAAWKAALPAAWRPRARPLPWWAAEEGEPVPFSRLTLTAQLQVLAHPARESWNRCLRWNPWLAGWRDAAGRGALPVPPWPARAAARVSPEAYGRRFWRDLGRALRETDPAAPAAVELQEDFVRERLRPDRGVPLLWASET